MTVSDAAPLPLRNDIHSSVLVDTFFVRIFITENEVVKEKLREAFTDIVLTTLFIIVEKPII